MNVNLTPELALLVQREVESGHYPDPSAVVGEAPRRMDEEDRLAWLRAAIALGLAELEHGEGILWTASTMAEFRAQAEEDDRLGAPIPNEVLP